MGTNSTASRVIEEQLAQVGASNVDTFELKDASQQKTRKKVIQSESVVDAIELEPVKSFDDDRDSYDYTNYDDDGFTYAEGGIAAWFVVFGSFLGILPTWGLYFSAGVIQTYVASHQLKDASTSSVSWIFSVSSCLLLGTSVFSGMYFDRYGARKPLVIGTIMTIGGVLAVAQCTKVWQFVLALSVCVGTGSGVTSSPLLGCICHHFYKRRAFATAVAINGGSIGGVIFPVFMEKSFKSLGFAWTMRIMALICGVCLTLSIFLIKEDPAKRAPIEPKGDDVSFVKNLLLNIRDSVDYNSLISDKKYLFCVIASCLAEVSTGAVLTYITSYCTTVGYTENTAFMMVTVLNTLSIVGGYIFSFLADKVMGRFNVMIVITFMLGFVPLIFWLPFGSKGPSVMYGFSAIYGLFYGSLLNLAPVCCGQISRTDEFGKRYATMYCFVGLSFLVAIPVSGVIIGNGSLNNYNNFIVYASVLTMFSSAMYAMSKGFAVKKKSQQLSEKCSQ
ncbi:unnamed protein product [Kluyveromyces dobzhanskii CBS 2104]|uniref:WGS project CCBQ000000000 data, contig 00015 n=1 Tax=Kluyveromyces dobzhanskii CBS 2104 TaxID=1427455 RepID=A0A0A8LBI4_9SACH|nr:unnamed protein product [Kluyveromyces dobzhanskii CBS 2104]